MAKLWNIYMLSINLLHTCHFFVCCVNCDNNEQSYECFDTWRKNIKYKIKYTGQGLCACKLVLITYVQSHCKGIFILR